MYRVSVTFAFFRESAQLFGKLQGREVDGTCFLQSQASIVASFGMGFGSEIQVSACVTVTK